MELKIKVMQTVFLSHVYGCCGFLTLNQDAEALDDSVG